MKRLKRKCIVMLAVVTAWFGLSLSPMIAKAEDVVETSSQESEILESTDESSIVEEIPVEEENVEISAKTETTEETATEETYAIDPELDQFLQPLICALGGLGGTGAVLLFALLFFKKAKKAFKELITWWKSKKEELSNDGIDLAKIREDIAQSVSSNEEVKQALSALSQKNSEEYQAFLSAVNTAIETATGLVKTAEAACEKRVELCEKEYHQIKEILIMIATGNGELIRRGTADAIVKKFNEEKLQMEE